MAKKDAARELEKRELPLPAGRVDHIIEVAVDMETLRLAVQQPRSLVKPGDQVIWVFRGVPEGWLPWVEFPHHQPYGPFPCVYLSGGALWAQVPDPAAGEGERTIFPYRASIRRGLGPKDNAYGAFLLSPLAELEVRDLEPRNLQVQVTYNPATGGLDISRSLVKRNPGDTVEWVFEIPADVLVAGTWKPRVDFFRFDGEHLGEPPDLSLGPFSTLKMGTHSVLGMGSNARPGIYSYVALAVSLSSDTVHLMSTPDPVIDDRGPVSTSGPG